jgi:hypothetical protein
VFLAPLRRTEQIGSGCNASDSYSGGARFVSRPGNSLFLQVIRGFPQPLQANSITFSRESFLPHATHFIIHHHTTIQSSIVCVICSVPCNEAGLIPTRLAFGRLPPSRLTTVLLNAILINFTSLRMREGWE